MELLVFPTGLAVVAMLFLNSLIERWMSERQMIVRRALFFSTNGLVPLVVQDYPSHLSESYSLWFGDRNDRAKGYFDYR